MPEFTWTSVGAALAGVISAVFDTIVSTLKKSYEASHKWFAVGCGIFAVLVYFGYVHLKVPAKDADLEKKIAELSAKIDSLPTKADLEALKPAPVVTGSIKKKLK